MNISPGVHPGRSPGAACVRRTRYPSVARPPRGHNRGRHLGEFCRTLPPASSRPLRETRVAPCQRRWLCLSAFCWKVKHPVARSRPRLGKGVMQAEACARSRGNGRTAEAIDAARDVLQERLTYKSCTWPPWLGLLCVLQFLSSVIVHLFALVKVYWLYCS